MADGSVKILTALDNTGLEKGLKSMNSKVAAGAKSAASAMATGLKGVGTAIGAATAAIGGVGAAVIKTGSEFEAKMSRVKAISSATSSEFQQLNAQAKKLGADTAFSASEAADGMENLAAAGFSVNEITKAMPGLLDMAAASGESIANSSEIASSALRAFGLDASKTGHIADVLAANANMTNAAVMDTGYAFKYAAPIAHSLGMSMEETTAAIGIMSNAGIKGEQAGTTLRGALTRLVKPTKQVKKGMAELGVSFFDSNGKMKSLDTIVGDLSTSTAKLTQQQKNQTLAQIFGTESLSGMLALVDAGPAQLDKLTKAYEHSDGAAKAAAKTMQDNLKGAIEQAGGSLETLGIDLYESVDNPAKKAV
ncbi:MAG: phage tail tape measure protein, partial [Ruminococcaceae bacterium]|nr:phage tail tape measure protein [Oscillospiraceae bacterium]